METFLSILSMIGIGILGILLQTLVNSKKYFKPGVFSIRIFIYENKFKWLYCLLITSVVAIIVNIIPDSAETIKNGTGLSVGEEIASFITLGYSLGGSMKADKNKRNEL